MQLDEARLADVIHRLCVHVALKEFGATGASAAARLWPLLRDLYRYIEPLMLRSPIAVAVAVDDSRPMPLHRSSNPRTFGALSLAAADVSWGGWVIELHNSGTTRLWKLDDVDIETLASFAIVYRYDDGVETLTAGRDVCRIPNLAPQASPSAFARPTYLSLEEALQHYRQGVARSSQCPNLQGAWYDRPRRLYWRAKPEEQMRRSLFHYLYNVLSTDAEIRPEQIVDESHPVDIKVTWYFVNRLALIEIKWMGDSRREDGTAATGYRDARARSGAKQLADYLDSNRQLTPTLHTKGYLVVFDARRQGLGPDVSSVSREEGFHYERLEVEYDPEYHRTRPDFAEPLRLFVEPIV